MNCSCVCFSGLVSRPAQLALSSGRPEVLLSCSCIYVSGPQLSSGRPGCSGVKAVPGQGPLRVPVAAGSIRAWETEAHGATCFVEV